MKKVIDLSLPSIRLNKGQHNISDVSKGLDSNHFNQKGTHNILTLDENPKSQQNPTETSKMLRKSIIPPIPQTYISDYIKLNFSNTTNLKADIQNRISENIEGEFTDALNAIEGDNKNNSGVRFSEITRLAMAYFYAKIFHDDINNEFYTLEMVKGFLDADNLTSYTAIHEIDVEYHKLKDAPYLNHCWLIIQSAWFFNSAHFGNHQHVDYLNYYIKTGEKLPLEKYNSDAHYLQKKYNDIDNKKCKGYSINGFTLVNQWYYGILFLVCKELNLPIKNFNTSLTDYREYNPLTKTSRQLRSLAPFKLLECDIMSAFPTFLDIETGANLKDHVYDNLILSRGITRDQAKVLFNKICNSGKYKCTLETKAFFMDCGYSDDQSDVIIEMTHAKSTKFISFMTEQESNAINRFILVNNLQRCARLHDAVIFIDNGSRPQNLRVLPNCDFKLKEMNKPVINESFSLGSKRLKYAYISSIPQGLILISRREFKKTEIKGEANGFRFYKNKYEYFSASFNLNDSKLDFKYFKIACVKMHDTLKFLNEKPLKSSDLIFILRHIRENSNIIFNVRAMYYSLKIKISNETILLQKKNYTLRSNTRYTTKSQFVNALNKAEKLVNINSNYKELFELLEERIKYNDYRYLVKPFFYGRKENNLLVYAIIQKFNLLVTGRSRKQRKDFSSNTLYSNSIKDVTTKSISLKSKLEQPFIKKGITKLQKKTLAVNKLIKNQDLAKQLFLILTNISGNTNELDIKEDVKVQNFLKAELMTIIDKSQSIDSQNRLNEFNKLYKIPKNNKLIGVSNLENIFDTNFNLSIFNQISIEEAYARKEPFFSEYLRFHNLEKKEFSSSNKITKKVASDFPEIDFGTSTFE